MKDLTSSIYTFENLIKGNFLYVDKTEYIWQLIKPASEMYFLSRPRRFGKSLTLSTLKAVFEGKKELFKGLALHDKPYDWKPYPIIHLDLANCDAHSEDALRDYLAKMMAKLAEQHNVKVSIDRTQVASSFSDLIEAVAQNDSVVILLDEYDKPILENITNPAVSSIRNTLADFYSSIKKEAEYERLVFITGVTKFCHVSLFSKLNNLTDLTMDARFATMLGYTQEELEMYFADRLASLAGKQDIDELKREIKKWYDGYRFEKNAKTVYNPVSLVKFFQSGGDFSNYWFSTGTPTFLLEAISKQRFNLEQALAEPVANFAFDAYDIGNLNPLTLLLQTGYLTIDCAVRRFGATAYRLRFPNLEVKDSFETYLAGHCSGLFNDQVKDSVFRLADAVTAGDVDGFMETMKVFFAKVPYDVHLKDENNFQLLFFSIFMLLGISITAESRTNSGRIDAVAANEDYVFVFEFKLDKGKELALEQIKERDYCRRYLNSGKQIRLIGVNFDKEAGQICDWVVQAI